GHHRHAGSGHRAHERVDGTGISRVAGGAVSARRPERKGRARPPGGEERGGASVIVVVLLACVMMIGAVVVAAAMNVAATGYTAGVADLAALAAAQERSCTAAERVVARNQQYRLTLARCEISGADAQVLVRAGTLTRIEAPSRARPAWWGGLAAHRSSSKAARRIASVEIAPALSRGLLPLPHLGDWMHRGQPVSHGHSRTAAWATRTHCRAAVYPRRANPDPPGKASCTNTVGASVESWTAVDNPPRSHRSQVATRPRRAMSACSAACNAPGSVDSATAFAPTTSAGNVHHQRAARRTRSGTA